MTDTHTSEQTVSNAGATWTWPERMGPWGPVSLLFVVVVSYSVGSWLALRLIEASGLQSVFFIPSGITVAFLLRLSRRSWWLVLVGAGLAEFVMDVISGYTTAQALGFAAGNVVEPLLAAAIVTTSCGAFDLARRRHFMWFTIGAVLIGPAAGAGVGAATDRLFGGDDFLTTFGQWWLGDALGVILVGSAILVWGSSRDRRSLFSWWGALLILGSIMMTVAMFGMTDLPLVFPVLVGVVVAGVVFGARAVAMTALAIATTIAFVLANSVEPFIVALTQSSALVLTKLQLGAFTLAGLLIAAESHERELATRLAARSVVETETLERERQRVHDLAVQLQRGLLPDKLLSRPGMDIAARYESASDVHEVGGDWYDAIELRDGRVALVVGDIVGHGIDAMISMGRLRAALSALAIHNDHPASLLTELDEFVGGPDGTAYATLFYAIVDTQEHIVTYASAGHPPALLVSPDGETIWLDQGQAEPLYGQVSTRRQASAALQPGWSLVLYSDGLIEQRGESLSVGLQRLETLASELGDKRPDAMCDSLFESLVSDATRSDDTVLLVVRSGMDTEEYHQVFPARPEELRKIRSSLRSWVGDRSIPAAVGEDLLIAVGEATANSARHAYRDAIGGDVTIRITLMDGILNVEVSDTGKWREPADEEAYPGLGTQIIESVVEGLHVDRTRRGTYVSFRLPLHRSAESPAAPSHSHP